MIDMAMYTNRGGRKNNEDYVTSAIKGTEHCFLLCDGLGGHECGEVASMSVAEYIKARFEEKGNSREFLSEAICGAQEELFRLQRERNMPGGMKTTLVALIVTDSIIKWAHIGDSRLYHIYDHGNRYERTKDHSLVQLLCDMGEISEGDIRNHVDRNKVLRVMGAPWTNNKGFTESPVLERDAEHAFVLMTDGFWEYVEEEEMLKLYRSTGTADEWLEGMKHIVEKKADMKYADNYSAICVKTNANL